MSDKESSDKPFRAHHIGMTTDFMGRDDPVNVIISGSPGRTEAIYEMLHMLGTRRWVETERKLPIGAELLEISIDNNEEILPPDTNRKRDPYKLRSVPIIVATSGMGFGSTEIVTQEVIETFVRSLVELIERLGASTDSTHRRQLNLIRAGTCGSHQPFVYGGDLVIATDTYVPFGGISDFISTPHDEIAHHLKLAGLLAAEKTLKYARRSSAVEKGDSITDAALEIVRYQLAKAEVVRSYSCSDELVLCCKDAARTLGLEQKIIHAGPVFSKLTLSSECYKDFTAQPDELRKLRLDYRSKVMHSEGIYCSEMEIGLMTAIALQARQRGYNVRVGGVMAVVNNPRNPEDRGATEFFANDRIIKKAVDRAINVALYAAAHSYMNARM